MSFLCPECGTLLRVTDTRPTMGQVYRRYECRRCSARFTTFERVAVEGEPSAGEAAAMLAEIRHALAALGDMREVKA